MNLREHVIIALTLTALTANIYGFWINLNAEGYSYPLKIIISTHFKMLKAEVGEIGANMIKKSYFYKTVAISWQ